MKAFAAFIKKENMSFTRSFKWLIVLFVFLSFGVMNPLVAKYTPLILENVMPPGMEMTLPEPTVLDAWLQFNKNIGQMGLIVMVLLFANGLSSEIKKESLILLLTKGLKRRTVILSKWFFQLCVWTIAFGVTALITWGYTLFLWTDTVVPYLFMNLFMLWLFGMTLFTMLLLGNVWFKNSYGAMLWVGGLMVFGFILNLFPIFDSFNPMNLISKNNALLAGALNASEFYGAIGIHLALIVIGLVTSLYFFNKKQI